MSLEDIEKLRARVEKDPDTKLFVPLAEEYRKEGLYDEAIDVLLRGLENQPGYTSASVALGKIYLERGQLNEAKEEFEKVVEVIPDNLFAQKKLAEIYKDTGVIDSSVKHYQKVLELNPLDEEAKEILNDLSGATSSPEFEISSEEVEKLYSLDRKDIEEVSEGGDEYSADSFEKMLSEELAGEDQEERTEGTLEDVKELEELLGDAETSPPEEKAESDYEQYKEFCKFIGEDVHEPQPEVCKTVPEEEQRSTIEEPGLPEETEERLSDVAEGISEGDLTPLLNEADQWINEGEYMKAVARYSDILRRNPDDRMVLQRVEDLKQYLKILGKGNDVLVYQLEDLLRKLKNRRDEFFGIS
jgi:tetratricopeptide (TPR) repeat protein